MAAAPSSAPPERVRVALHGAVQGVGFRPFVYRLASSLGLAGWTLNSSSGLVIEVQGQPSVLRDFLRRLETERPLASRVLAQETVWLDAAELYGFEIRPSETGRISDTAVLPDLATCPECLSEVLDPAGRRHEYPFTNCTQCGPRYSIVQGIPYDRPNTTMSGFLMCRECRDEYTDPADRRFHAQPVACPSCGPRLEVSITDAAAALDRGEIVAWKGIGGFQLLVDATNPAAVDRLRIRKKRNAKPLALMMPDLACVRRCCVVSGAEERVLASAAAPIVLLKPRPANGIAPNVSDASPFLGVMLPYSPMHHLLMGRRPKPVVATSGNVSGDPIAIGNLEAAGRLAGIADAFVSHDREIVRPVDDSVVRVAKGREQILRRARGYAPLPVRVARALAPVLAVGAHMKNTVAIARGRDVYLSQHLGDLDSLASVQAFERAIEDLRTLYSFKPEAVVCDLHPGYASTIWARQSGLPVVAVQHHHAHAAACAAENDLTEPHLAVVWDGTGYGLDRSIWGGEFFIVDGGGFHRVCHLRPFALPGGEAAVKQGWRIAAALRHELGLQFESPGRRGEIIRQMLRRGLNCPRTSSAGRLFDAVSALIGLAGESVFEGHAAMLLEQAAWASDDRGAYELPIRNGQADWAGLVLSLERDRQLGVPIPSLARRFHFALAGAIVAVAKLCRIRHVLLSGGVFQNGLLSRLAEEMLQDSGCRVYTHQRVPPNDGGISLGQAFLAGSGNAAYDGSAAAFPC